MKACSDKHKIAHHQKKLNETLKKKGSKLCSTAYKDKEDKFFSR